MDPLLLRFIERLTAVLIGGLAIYLGYRLFLSVRDYKDSDGKVALPRNISVVMTKVGPGVFFALFGVIAVSLALIRPLEVNKPAQNNSQEKAAASSSYSYGTGSDTGPSANPDNTGSQTAANRTNVLSDIATLNRFANDITRQHEKDKTSRVTVTVDSDRFMDLIDRTKTSLLLSVWSREWGDPEEFKRWATLEPGYSYGDPPSGIKGAAAIFKGGQ
jgi:hypothetical protein